MVHTQTLTGSVEEYLEAIHRFTAAEQGVTTTGLAQALGVRPASVTGMLKRLAELGLLRYRKYGEIALTSQGEQRAHQVVRRHRLTERLLTDLLDVPLDQAHEEACLLEHAVSPSLETRIEKALGGPDACPHGHPIDASADDHTISLLEAPLSRALRVIRLQDEQPEVVRYLARAGLLPGARVKIAKRDPFSGAISLETDDQSLTLGPQLAASVRVEQPRRRA